MFHQKDTKLHLFIHHTLLGIAFYTNQIKTRLQLIKKKECELVKFYDGLHKNKNNKKINK